MGGGGVPERISRRTIFFFIAAVVLLCYVSPIYKSFPGICDSPLCFPHHPVVWEATNPDYLVYTVGCKISNMNPFDVSVRKYIKRGRLQVCQRPLVISKNKMLQMNGKLISNSKYKNTKCCYHAVERVTQNPEKYNKDADWGIRTTGNCIPIPQNPDEATTITSQFVQIECRSSTSDKMLYDFYATVFPPDQHSNQTRAKANFWKTMSKTPPASGENVSNSIENDQLEEKREPPPKLSRSALPPSVLILGIDSISRLHMIRSLTETKQFLSDNDFIEMKGYTKIGENTFPNMMGILGGMDLNKYPCWKGSDKKIDDCPFIWKNFSRHQYATAFLEDSPNLAIFNYMKTGFVESPVDYYLRPMAVAYSKKLSKLGNCVGGMSQTEVMLQYLKDVVTEMTGVVPYFLLSWFTSIAHDDFNGLKPSDSKFRDTLADAVRIGGDNTVILFISDHGYRFGHFRETFLGYYEESLPFFFMRLPPSLKASHPDWYHNLKINSEKLTSPLDLHATLEDILSLSSPSGTENNFQFTHSNRSPSYRPVYSFFEPTPSNRTCETSGISQVFCRCGVTPDIDKRSKLTSKFGEIVVQHVNSLLRDQIEVNHCAQLKFKSILYGREINNGETWNNFGKLITFKDYLVALEVSPSSAHLEATVRLHSNETTSIVGDVSRINSYKGQSDCEEDYRLKNYCMCRGALDRIEREKLQKKTIEAKKKMEAKRKKRVTTTRAAKRIQQSQTPMTTTTTTTATSPSPSTFTTMRFNTTTPHTTTISF